MIFLRTTLCCIVLLTSTCISFGQQHYPKTLLWRITGNGLKKPSYLFGTMHLTDKRLFNFGDSVYSAIEKTDGLALEVNPDEMIAYAVNDAIDKMLSPKRLQEILSQKNFTRDSLALAQKFNKPASEVTTHDIYKEKNKWVNQYMQKGEMPTFLDAHLYTIAKKLGKWLGGIEDVGDQAGLMEDLIDESDVNYVIADSKGSGQTSSMEQLVNTYTNQDLEGIERITEASETQERKDIILIRRNIKMARRIDSLTACRTMFFAIGAAHLPGDSGVISMLKARGFTVEPVISSKKIAANDYKVKEVELPWVGVADSKGQYNISMPGKPTPIKVFGLLEMQFLFDISNFCGYYTMAVVSAHGQENNDSLFNSLTSRMFQKEKVTPVRKMLLGEADGREYVENKEGYTIRLQVYRKNNIVYLVAMYALKKENVSSPLADKYFGSFVINTIADAGPQNFVFSDTTMGVAFSSPAYMQYNKTLSNKVKTEGWKISIFSGSDANTGAYVMLFSKEVAAGMFIVSDTAVFGKTQKQMQLQYDHLTVNDTTVQGYHVQEMTGRNKRQNIFVHLYNAIAANRNIVLMTLSDSVGMYKPAIQQVFGTLTFLNQHSITHWAKKTTPNGAFTTWVPSSFRVYASRANALQTVAYDTTTATTYAVIEDSLGKYTWADSDSIFWKKQEKRWQAGDSTVSTTIVQNGQLTGREVLAKSKDGINIYKRKRLVLNGNILYVLMTCGDRHLLYSDDANKFFADFAVNGADKPNDIFTSKAALLLQDLASADSATRNGAYLSVSNAPFGEKDLPLLHDALFKRYLPTNEYSDTAEVNTKLANKLATMRSKQTVQFIKSTYPNFGPPTEKYKSIALSLLAGMHTQDSYNAFATLLLQNTPASQPGYSLRSDLKDSLPLTATIYPTLLKMAGDTLWAPTLANLGLTLADSGLVDIKTSATAEDGFIKAARLLLPRLKIDASSDYNITSLTNLLAKFNTAASFSVLEEYLAVKEKFLKKNVVKLLLQNNQSVSAAVLLSLAKDAETRKPFYKELKALNKQSFFPAQYVTQQAFAESDMYNAATGEDEENIPTGITFLTKKIGTYKNKKYSFYLYKVVFGEGKDTSAYLGVAGGYAIGSTGLETAEDINGLYYEDNFKALKINEQFTAFLKSEEKAPEEEQPAQ